MIPNGSIATLASRLCKKWSASLCGRPTVAALVGRDVVPERFVGRIDSEIINRLQTEGFAHIDRVLPVSNGCTVACSRAQAFSRRAANDHFCVYVRKDSGDGGSFREGWDHQQDAGQCRCADMHHSTTLSVACLLRVSLGSVAIVGHVHRMRAGAMRMFFANSATTAEPRAPVRYVEYGRGHCASRPDQDNAGAWESDDIFLKAGHDQSGWARASSQSR
jgi:hypothetical protein